MINNNITLLTDFYQLTMMNGYYKNNMKDKEVVFDLFFRDNPCDSGYTMIAGIEQVIDYILNLKFSKSDIDYLRSLGTFDDEFLAELESFKFKGDIYGVEEGSIMFPHEPILRVSGNAFESQLIETALLNIINHQSLIATKASRIVEVASNQPVFEFGLRRAQGPDAGVLGARAAMIGGCVSTSNVLAGKEFKVPLTGTMAHSWVQSFPTELEAFYAYANVYPDNTLLLVDTYDTLKHGIPNAIKVFNHLKEKGYTPKGIRIDSGDLAYMSKIARKMLDEAGFKNAMIIASSDLDEYTINSLKQQGAKIDGWGVGTNLITSKACPALGGVYKLSASKEKDGWIPKIKISNNPEKITNPGCKNIYRIFNKTNDKAMADLISLEDEVIDTNKPLTIFHPIYTWKTTTFENYYIKKLLQPIFKKGELVTKRKTTEEVRKFAKDSLSSLWPEYKRINKPHIYKVDLSSKLWTLKRDLLNRYRP